MSDGRRDFLKSLLVLPLAVGGIAAKRSNKETELDRLLREETEEEKLLDSFRTGQGQGAYAYVSYAEDFDENFCRIQRHLERQGRITQLLLEERRRG